MFRSGWLPVCLSCMLFAILSVRSYAFSSLSVLFVFCCFLFFNYDLSVVYELLDLFISLGWVLGSEDNFVTPGSKSLILVRELQKVIFACILCNSAQFYPHYQKLFYSWLIFMSFFIFQVLNISRSLSRKSSIASYTSKASVYSDASSIPPAPNPSTSAIKNCQKRLCRMYRAFLYRPRYYGKPFEDRYNEDGKVWILSFVLLVVPSVIYYLVLNWCVIKDIIFVMLRYLKFCGLKLTEAKNQLSNRSSRCWNRSILRIART